MARRRIGKTTLDSLRGVSGPGDGLDPRLERPDSAADRGGRKARQLCGQAAEALSYALATTADDEIVAGLTVASVRPGPDSSSMIVSVSPPPGEVHDPDDLLARLHRAGGRLRAEVARAITRRRTPTLTFRVEMG